MLVLSRKAGEKIIIGEDITITVLEMSGNQIRLGFEAPDQVKIMRSELQSRQPRPIEEAKAIDPDLAVKPAEWKAAKGILVRSQQRSKR